MTETEVTEKIISVTVRRFDDPKLATEEPTLHQIALPLNANYPELKKIVYEFLKIDIKDEVKIVKIRCPIRRLIPYSLLLHDFETDKPFIIEVVNAKPPVFMLHEINKEIQDKDPLAELDWELMDVEKTIMHLENSLPTAFLNSMKVTENSCEDLLNRLSFLKRKLGVDF